MEGKVVAVEKPWFGDSWARAWQSHDETSVGNENKSQRFKTP